MLALSLGCGSGGGTTDPDPDDPDPDPPAVAAVEIAPENQLVEVDDVGQLTARVTDAEGTVLTGRTVSWLSLDDGLATVSSDGEVSALSYGDARIVAISEGKSDTVVVRSRLRFTHVSVGGNLACGLITSGAAWCWGNNENGALGARLNAPISTIPIRVADGHRFTTISVGLSHTCALDADLAAWCWGANFSGIVGNGIPNVSVDYPDRVIGDHRFLAISAGSNNTCALDESRLAYCWGTASVGRIPGSSEDQAFPFAIAAPGTPQPLTFESIQVGLGHSCGMATEIDGGKLWCWGDNSVGQVIPQGTEPVYAQVDAPLIPFTYSVGVNFTCYTGVDDATRETPISQCRGFDIANDPPPPNTIRLYPSVAGAEAMDAGVAFACALLPGGDLRCWGANDSGQLGIGAEGEPVATPVVPVGGRSWTRMDLGWSQVCAIDSEGIMYCWGNNVSGMLGDGTIDNRNVPTAVAGQL